MKNVSYLLCDLGKGVAEHELASICTSKYVPLKKKHINTLSLSILFVLPINFKHAIILFLVHYNASLSKTASSKL